MTVSTSQPKLSEALANVGLSSGSITDRRVREQLGGRQSNGHGLSEYKGLVTGLYTNLVGDWNQSPQADGNIYKGYDGVAADINSREGISFPSQNDTPNYKACELSAVANGTGGGDRIHEVRMANRITESGTYRLTFEMKVDVNGSYSNFEWQVAVVGSSTNYLAGAINLDLYRDGIAIYASKSWAPQSHNVTLTTARPYITCHMYACMRDGGSWADPAEKISWRYFKLVKV